MIIQRMRDRMSDHGFSQADLAREAGCTQGAVQQILAGSTRRSRMLPEIASALHTTVEYLTGATDHAGRGAMDAAVASEEDGGVDVNTRGNSIREYRKAARLSVSELARRTGLEGSSLFNWERGRRNIGLRDAWTLARAIGAPLSAISTELGRIAVEAAAMETHTRDEGAVSVVHGDVAAWVEARDALASMRPGWTAAELNDAASSVVAMRWSSERRI